MFPIEIFAAMLAVVAVLAAVAMRARIPYPVVLVLGGLALAAIPGLPVPRLDPELIFLGFLPPLVYSAAFLSSSYELADNVLPIGTLAVGLVLATMAVIAVLGHFVVGLGWSVAAVLGAIVAPTDPVAATAVARRLTAPDRLVTILEGEALVNDGTGLTAYTVALGAVGAAFSIGHAALQLVEIVAGGVAIGVAVGWLFARLRRLGDDPRLEITLSLLTPWAAYLPADRIGASGVLAAVTAGLWVGRQAQEIAPAPTRIQAQAFWELLTFLLNSTLFLLIGLQLRQIVSGLAPGQAWSLTGGAVAIAVGLMLLRLAWMAVGARRFGLAPQRGESGARLNLRAHLVLGWCGMRGGVSLAAALAIPIAMHGSPFPHRSAVLLLTYTTIIATLVLPGLTLPSLITRLGLGQGKERRREELEARIHLTHAALSRLEEMAEDGFDGDEGHLGGVRAIYEARLETLHNRLEAEGDERGEEDDPAQVREIRRDVLAAQREALGSLRGDRKLPDSILRELEHDLDLEESRLTRT
jgi:CPA1 family monovalent cation:H+ antiporter